MVALLKRTASPRVAPEKLILSSRWCLLKVTHYALPLLRLPMPLRVSRAFPGGGNSGGRLVTPDAGTDLLSDGEA